MGMVGESVAGAEKENVLTQTAERILLKAGDCAVTLLPQFGGKVASICVKGHELLQAPLAPVAPRTPTMAFDAGDASGWDECLPSVAACAVETAAGPVQIPDHGDLWRVEWKIREQGTATPTSASRSLGTPAGNRDQESRTITLQGDCFSLPLALKRTFRLAEWAEGWSLQLDYLLTNVGQVSAPWSWAAHPLFAVDVGDTIELPASIATLQIEGSGGKRLGATGETVGWPVAKGARDSEGRETKLNVVQGLSSRIADKLFAGPLAAGENWCALHRRKEGLRIRVGFDSAATPYLGLWLCYGGWPERKGPKQMCVAMEPATAPVDSLAQTGEWSRVLGPGERYAWQMRVAIEIV
jgi:galactose mutarotase-like enzyme